MSKPNPAPPPESEFEAAKASLDAAARRRSEVSGRIEGMRMALSLSRSGDNERVPPRLVAAAEPYMATARKRRDRLAAQLADAEDEMEAAGQEYATARAAYEIAARRETTRIATALQPRHRAAVADLMTAVEAMSRAIAAEREVRDELAATAPLAVSAVLPDLSSDLLIGTLPEFASPARMWVRKLKQTGHIK